MNDKENLSKVKLSNRSKLSLRKTTPSAPTSKQTGQVIVLFVISAMTFVFALGLLFNTGQQIHLKIKTQNALDSTIVTNSAHVARGLNVMAMNNVALTQMFSLNVLIVTLMPELAEATRNTIKEFIYHSKGAAEWCPSAVWPNVPAMIACAYHIAILAYLYTIYDQLSDIWADIGAPLNLRSLLGGLKPVKLHLANEVMDALDGMNNQLVDSYAGLTQKINKDVSQLNGLDEPPIITGGPAYAIEVGGKLTGSNYGTRLPVTETNPFNGGLSGALNFTKVAEIAQDFQLCITSFYGTPKQLPFMFKNIADHGYPKGVGPFRLGKKPFIDTISRPVDKLENLDDVEKHNPFSHDPDAEVNTHMSDQIWAGERDATTPFSSTTFISSCILEGYFNFENGAQALLGIPPLPKGRLNLFRVNKPVPAASLEGKGFSVSLSGDSSDWVIMGLARKGQFSGFVGESLFHNPVGGHYAVSQTEVFNPIFYDLYTQHWRWELQPANFVNMGRSAWVNDFRGILENSKWGDKFIDVMIPENSAESAERASKYTSH